MFDLPKLRAPGRRVVAGNNASGKSVVGSDEPVPKNATWSQTGIGSGGGRLRPFALNRHADLTWPPKSDPLSEISAVGH